MSAYDRAVFAIVLLAFVLLATCGCVLAARAHRGKPLSAFGQPPRRLEAALETEDLEQMLAVTNARRRARGLPERSLSDAIREFGDG